MAVSSCRVQPKSAMYCSWDLIVVVGGCSRRHATQKRGVERRGKKEQVAAGGGCWDPKRKPPRHPRTGSWRQHRNRDGYLSAATQQPTSRRGSGPALVRVGGSRFLETQHQQMLAVARASSERKKQRAYGRAWLSRHKYSALEGLGAGGQDLRGATCGAVFAEGVELPARHLRGARAAGPPSCADLGDFFF